MEYQKIINLLNTTSDNVPRFNTKKWMEVHDQSGKIYNPNKQIRFNTLRTKRGRVGGGGGCFNGPQPIYKYIFKQHF